MKRFFLNIWGNFFRLILQRSVTFHVGENSKICYDRIRPAPGCTISVGRDCIINTRIAFDRPGASFDCGDRCYIGASHLVSAQQISLGDDVLVSWGVTIVDHNSHAIDWPQRENDVLNWGESMKDWSNVKITPVRINERAWVGFNAIILKGVTIGQGAIVAAGAVVTKDVPPYSVVAGNPARVIRTLSEFER